jgi:hypothetical protein
MDEIATLSKNGKTIGVRYPSTERLRTFVNREPEITLDIIGPTLVIVVIAVL